MDSLISNGHKGMISCAISKKKVMLGGKCDGKNEMCDVGLTCVKLGDEKSCRKLVGPGFKCKKHPFVVCKPHLNCCGANEHAICVAPYAQSILAKSRPLGNV